MTIGLSRALSYAGTHHPADVAEGVASGRFQQWGDGDSVIVTEIIDTPRRRTLRFFLAEGSMPEIRAMIPAILDWGRMHGCSHASLVGRKGWARVPWMLADGWVEKHIVMEREL